LFSFFLGRLNTTNYFTDIFDQLSFQILIAGIILFFLLIFLKKIRTSVFCIIICFFLAIDILPACKHCSALVKTNPQNDSKIRLMTFNTSYATDSNIGKWYLYLEELLIENKNPKMDDTKNLEVLQKLILTENPDIVHFQEINQNFKDKINTLRSILPYSHLIQYDEFPGIADSIILSKHPFKGKNIEDNSIITKIIIKETELDILSVHLYSTFSKYRFNLANKQIESLKNLIKDNNQNLIVIGDLNMTNVSKRFINFIEEANLYTYTSYIHPTFTWPAYLPSYFGIQIDHVLFSENIKMLKKKTVGHLGSDHRALIVDLIF
jgi:endonuclease/exonuclease/phosphatase (EEP) superfamily protein YafD